MPMSDLRSVGRGLLGQVRHFRIAQGGSGTDGYGGEGVGGDCRRMSEPNPPRTLRVYNQLSLLVPKRSFLCSPSPESVWAIPSATSP
jgi:hypothetical protein